jgi:hypothetical protein
MRRLRRERVRLTRCSTTGSKARSAVRCGRGIAARSIVRTLATDKSGGRSVARSVTRVGSRGAAAPSRVWSRRRTGRPGSSAPGGAPGRGTSRPTARLDRSLTWHPDWPSRSESADAAAGSSAPASSRVGRCLGCSCPYPVMSDGQAATPGRWPTGRVALRCWSYVRRQATPVDRFFGRLLLSGSRRPRGQCSTLRILGLPVAKGKTVSRLSMEL